MIWVITKKKFFSKSSSLVCCKTRHTFQVGPALLFHFQSVFLLQTWKQRTLTQFVNDITLVGVGIILENRMRLISGFRMWKYGMKSRRWNQKLRVKLWKKKCNTKLEYVAKQQTKQSS